MGQFTKNYRTFYPKIVIKLSKIWVWDPGSGKTIFRIPDPGVKKAPDPGSATLLFIINTTTKTLMKNNFRVHLPFSWILFI